MTIDRTNFHLASFGVFTRCKTPEAKPDYESYTGSKYWFIDDELVRYSNHWTHKIRSCAWVLSLGQDKQDEWITAKVKFSEMTDRKSRLCSKSFILRKRYKAIIKERKAA